MAYELLDTKWQVWPNIAPFKGYTGITREIYLLNLISEKLESLLYCERNTLHGIMFNNYVDGNNANG